ncbi:serine/arginine repetitive matrix protein 2 isoform X1 [Hyalella azteca]|uniref:Serine/arginine repetitive matrix protein 2 isoform X1 n=1 Tax=Hyalella azteca TaxID=294128 RepID=A0A8B7N9Y4_HYAAZ|nr:serine/arginine repetitive matrix protein 2 isoform X1 [Hyalella azteca]
MSRRGAVGRSNSPGLARDSSSSWARCLEISRVREENLYQSSIRQSSVEFRNVDCGRPSRRGHSVLGISRPDLSPSRRLASVIETDDTSFANSSCSSLMPALRSCVTIAQRSSTHRSSPTASIASTSAALATVDEQWPRMVATLLAQQSALLHKLAAASECRASSGSGAALVPPVMLPRRKWRNRRNRQRKRLRRLFSATGAFVCPAPATVEDKDDKSPPRHERCERDSSVGSSSHSSQDEPPASKIRQHTLRSYVSVHETHAVAEAQHEKNAKLKEAFGISEYFVEGSSFDPQRRAKEEVVRQAREAEEAAKREAERVKEAERREAAKKEAAAGGVKTYAWVRTPSPEPSTATTDSKLKKDKKRKKKRSRDRSSSSEPPKKHKSKKRKRNRSASPKRSKHPKTKVSKKKKKKETKTKKRRHSSSSSSESVDDSDVRESRSGQRGEPRKRSASPSRDASSGRRSSGVKN